MRHSSLPLFVSTRSQRLRCEFGKSLLAVALLMVAAGVQPAAAAKPASSGSSKSMQAKTKPAPSAQVALDGRKGKKQASAQSNQEAGKRDSKSPQVTRGSATQRGKVSAKAPKAGLMAASSKEGNFKSNKSGRDAIAEVIGKNRKVIAADRVTPVSLLKPAASAMGGAGLAAGSRVSYAERAGLAHGMDELGLKASVAYVVDQDSNAVLLNKNAEAVLPIASITKLMTALVISESRQPLDEILTITEADIDTEKGTRSRLNVGTQLSRGELLHLALMSSENRAANALGRYYPGGLSAFVRAMNSKAAAIGMRNTRYVEPTGLSSRNQSSAMDLAKLLNVAQKDPLLSSLSTDPSLDVEVGGHFQRFNNTNRLVHDARWGIGVQKTGYISESGQCLVLQSQIQGRNVLIVLLDSESRDSRIADAQRVREWLYAQQRFSGPTAQSLAVYQQPQPVLASQPSAGEESD